MSQRAKGSPVFLEISFDSMNMSSSLMLLNSEFESARIERPSNQFLIGLKFFIKEV